MVEGLTFAEMNKQGKLHRYIPIGVQEVVMGILRFLFLAAWRTRRSLRQIARNAIAAGRLRGCSIEMEMKLD
jgi:hypothetical protein